MTEFASPVVLFAFRRPLHTQQVLDSLAANYDADRSVLHIYCDGAKDGADPEDLRDIAHVRRIARAECRFKETIIVERPKNIGLAESIILGVTEVIERYGTAIVVEDDLILSRYFLRYMNDSLQRYENDARVGQIGACNFFACGPRYPISFFLQIPDCWGWATWADRWRHFDPDAADLYKKLKKAGLMHRFNVEGAYAMDRMLQRQIEGRVDSWAIRWQAVCVLKNWWILYPNPSMSNHVESHKNTHTSANILPPIATQEVVYQAPPIAENAAVIRAMKRAYAGIGNSDGSLNLRATRALLRYIFRRVLPECLLSRWDSMRDRQCKAGSSDVTSTKAGNRWR
jgi:hypothetical protein